MRILLKNMENKPLFKKTDIIIIALVLLTAFLFALPGLIEKNKSSVAIITADNEIIAEIPLNGAEERTLEVNGTKITVRNGEIFFSESVCKDKVCVKTGTLKNPGDSSACIPNKVSIYIKGQSDEFDVIAY